MKKLSFNSHSSKETINFAKKISSFLNLGDTLGLFGNLGSGKTTFVKGLAKGLGFKGRVNSPSFVILKIYSIGKRGLKKKIIPLYHFDLYRLNLLKEIEDTGYEDFVSDCGICVIEWADRAKKLLPKHYLKVEIKIKDKNIRTINLFGYGQRYERLLTKMRPLKNS